MRVTRERERSAVLLRSFLTSAVRAFGMAIDYVAKYRCTSDSEVAQQRDEGHLPEATRRQVPRERDCDFPLFDV